MVTSTNPILASTEKLVLSKWLKINQTLYTELALVKSVSYGWYSLGAVLKPHSRDPQDKPTL